MSGWRIFSSVPFPEPCLSNTGSEISTSTSIHHRSKEPACKLGQCTKQPGTVNGCSQTTIMKSQRSKQIPGNKENDQDVKQISSVWYIGEKQNKTHQDGYLIAPYSTSKQEKDGALALRQVSSCSLLFPHTSKILHKMYCIMTHIFK